MEERFKLEDDKKVILIQTARVYTGNHYITRYVCSPRLYVTELQKSNIELGVHRGKTPNIVKSKILKLLNNLHIDVSRYRFEVKEG